MKTVGAIYRGQGRVELSETLDLPVNTSVLVLVPEQDEQDDEEGINDNLRLTVEDVFMKLWDNEEDEVWNRY